jgi:hypothetical protein
MCVYMCMNYLALHSLMDHDVSFRWDDGASHTLTLTIYSV